MGPKVVYTKEPNVNVNVFPGRWNLIDITPQKEGKFLTELGKNYEISLILSDTPMGTTEGTKLDSFEDGSSYLEIDLNNFSGVFDGKENTPDGFCVKTQTSRGEIEIDFKVNSSKILVGFKTTVSASNFEDSLFFIIPIVSSLINNFSYKQKVPFYTKRIFIKNENGQIRTLFLSGFKPSRWDGKMPSYKINQLRAHALSIKKEVNSSYYHPTLNLAIQYKLYELFERVLIQAKRKKLIEIVNKLESLSQKILMGDFSLNGKTYKEIFSFVRDNFRDKILHGMLGTGDELANIDDIKLFFESIKCLKGVEIAQEEIFLALMNLPDDFKIDLKSR
jgi:hypothetical protein